MSGIRLIAIRVGLAAVALVALWGVWRFTAERWSLLVDRVYTARMLVIRSTPSAGTAPIFNSKTPYPASLD
jgi:hypothetical protein